MASKTIAFAFKKEGGGFTRLVGYLVDWTQPDQSVGDVLVVKTSAPKRRRLPPGRYTYRFLVEGYPSKVEVTAKQSGQPEKSKSITEGLDEDIMFSLHFRVHA